MPNLNCSVSNCAHNCSSLCGLNSIDVAGNNAHSTDATCCTNFLEGHGATNHSENAVPETEISCQATNCSHNEGCKCHAQSVDVAGFEATNEFDTACSSFCEY
ncbi:MAG: hypothetical protein ATN36_06755 [Epulopiscium sp. Nele67-Bin005]|nr:MAG: hypothetical protein ATN36_06755 [Epulopiscium sp. Nele67-Bin005]